MPQDDYDRMCSVENLRRAYRWTQSNPEALYKSYFRDAYAAYAAASQQNLRRLRKHLVRRAYDPGHASKLYLPKPSGILRPYTLLTVNDQIVYQACANIIAEKLHPKIKHRYLKTVFGNLYAGKSSKFFYLRWQKGYRAYSDSVVANIKDGYNYVANFDLASFYDSIDHHVLSSFLKEITIDSELVEFLLPCLRNWTSSTWTNQSNAIYHEHGIPQGPLASGILSEIVIKHIDDRGARSRKSRYLRYVDDIKIFGKSEGMLRQRLVTLDLAAKEIGLFPQSSKVNIRKVSDPLDEVKSVSNPPEPAVTPTLDQQKLRKRILELTRRATVGSEDITRFKYLIARAEPHHTLNLRLIKVLEGQPSLSTQIASYISRYDKIPRKAADYLLEHIRGDEIYHAARANILFAIMDKMPEPQKSRCAEFCYRRLFSRRRGLPPPQPTYKAALLGWTLKTNRLTYAELHDLVINEVDWWVAKDFVKYLTQDQYGPASYEQLLNELIRQLGAEPARIAALRMVDDDITVHNPYNTAHEAARLLLYAAGKVRRIGRPESLVETVLNYVLGVTLDDFSWGTFFGGKHKAAEHIAFTIKRNYETDINACIVTLDSLCDLLWEVIFARELPRKIYGDYGSMVHHPALIRKFPKAASGLDKLHQLRLHSVTAHPRHRRTGRDTRRLKHSDYYAIRPDLRDAFAEIVATVAI